MCVSFGIVICDQRLPSEIPILKGEIRKQKQNHTTASDTGRRRAWQAWHHVDRCPKGTVPIRRSSVQDVLRAKSLFHYGKKQVNTVPLARSLDAPDVVSGNGHEVIIYLHALFILFVCFFYFVVFFLLDSLKMSEIIFGRRHLILSYLHLGPNSVCIVRK